MIIDCSVPSYGSIGNWQSTIDNAMDGLLVIDKPPGITSHDVVGEVRRILRQRKVGHTGTLDPFATGVLLVLIGRATRLAQFMSNHEKEYEAVIRLGYATDTGDITGHPVEASRRRPSLSESQIESARRSLLGDIQQIPPMYSAKKREGRKLYELARNGIEVPRDPVTICIHELETIRRDGSLLADNHDGTFDMRVRVVCSAGTYIRTLAEDFGKRLGTGAHLAELRRVRAGDFSESMASTLDQLKESVLEEALGKILLPPVAALSRLPFMHLSAHDEHQARNGLAVRATEGDWADETRIKMLDAHGNLVGVGCFDADKRLVKPRVVLAA